jgi:uncharacterized membrane protein
MKKSGKLLLILFIIFCGISFNSCNKSGSDVPSANACDANATAGPLFSAVKNLMQANCVSCHNTSLANGGMNWTVNCNIVANKDRVKARAVDNIPSPMPPTGPLPQSEKDKINAWINAGGRYTD